MGDEGYSGSDTFRYIDRLIKNGDDDLRIVTPFISVFYARKLLKAARKRRVRLITSNSEINKGALNLLKRRGLSKHWKVILYLLALSAILVFLRLYLPAFISLLLLGAVLVFAHRSGMGLGGRLEIRIVREPFVHEKLYITKNEAITGSANLTFKGTHSNVEHLDIIRDGESIAKLSRHFDKLWKNPSETNGL